MTNPNPELYEAITEHWGERCAEYDPGCFCCRAWDQFDAVAELQKRLAEVEQSRDTTYEIERQYTDRWMAAWEKFRKEKDNAEATTVFREFLNEPFSAKRISEAVLRAESAEAKLAAVRAICQTSED